MACISMPIPAARMAVGRSGAKIRLAVRAVYSSSHHKLGVMPGTWRTQQVLVWVRPPTTETGSQPR
ncbi:MAG: hypothetical protein ACI97B_004838, partial [Verrucomicrobiales bacterium]